MSFPGLSSRNCPQPANSCAPKPTADPGAGGQQAGPHFLSGLSRSLLTLLPTWLGQPERGPGAPEAETGPKAGPAAPKLQLGLCNCPQALAGPSWIHGFLPRLGEKG